MKALYREQQQARAPKLLTFFPGEKYKCQPNQSLDKKKQKTGNTYSLQPFFLIVLIFVRILLFHTGFNEKAPDALTTGAYNNIVSN